MGRLSETDTIAREIQEWSEKYQVQTKEYNRRRQAAKKLSVTTRLAWKKALQKAIAILEEESENDTVLKPFLHPTIAVLHRKKARI